MLDTIILQIPRGKYEIFDHNKFTPPTTRMLDNPLPHYKYTNNPTAYDKSLKIYRPCLTIYKRGMNFDLKIEFSAPKVLFNNNVDELEEKDFDEIIRRLQEKIFAMGVKVDKNALKYAQVLAFHPSKNIPLTGGYTSTFAIKELAKIDISQKFDITKVKYKNNGEQLQFYTNSHSIVFYDKISDLKNPKSRAVDKCQTKYQRSLFEYLKEKRRVELLRMEVRLSKKRKMNEILKQVGYSPDPLLNDIFKKDLCQKILNLYWAKFFSDNRFIYSLNTPQEILQLIIMKCPEVEISKILQAAGLYLLCRDEEGIRGFRQIIDSYKPKTNWTAVKRKLKVFEDKIFSNSVWGFLRDIEKELKDLKPFRMVR